MAIVLGKLNLHLARRARLRKAVALMVAASFLFPTLAWAFDPGLYQAGPFELLFQGQPFALPNTHGQVVSAHQGQGPLVIHIQDLHCNYEVQKNIAGLLHYLAKNRGLRLVALEGNTASLDTTVIAGFPLAPVREVVSDYLLRRGKISGAEYYAITGPHPMTLEGVETPDLYAANRASVDIVLNEESAGSCADLRDALNAAARKHASPGWLAFQQQAEAFREGRLDPRAYSRLLNTLAARHRLPREVYAGIAEVPGKAADPEAWLDQAAAVEQALLEQLARTQADRDLGAALQRAAMLERLLGISASPQDLASVRQQPQAFCLGAFANGLSCAAADAGALADLAVLDRYLAEALRFYEVADRRSQDLAANLLARMQAQHAGLAVLITGGFHTEHVLASLKQAGASYIAFKPERKRLDTLNPYFDILRGKPTPLEKMLAANQNLFMPASAFPKKGAASGARETVFCREAKLLLLVRAVGHFLETLGAKQRASAGWRQVLQQAVDRTLARYRQRLQAAQDPELEFGVNLDALDQHGRDVVSFPWFLSGKTGRAVAWREGQPDPLADTAGRLETADLQGMQIALVDTAALGRMETRLNTGPKRGADRSRLLAWWAGLPGWQKLQWSASAASVLLAGYGLATGQIDLGRDWLGVGGAMAVLQGARLKLPAKIPLDLPQVPVTMRSLVENLLAFGWLDSASLQQALARNNRPVWEPRDYLTLLLPLLRWPGTREQLFTPGAQNVILKSGLAAFLGHADWLWRYAGEQAAAGRRLAPYTIASLSISQKSQAELLACLDFTTQAGYPDRVAASLIQRARPVSEMRAMAAALKSAGIAEAHHPLILASALAPGDLADPQVLAELRQPSQRTLRQVLAALVARRRVDLQDERRAALRTLQELFSQRPLLAPDHPVWNDLFDQMPEKDGTILSRLLAEIERDGKPWIRPALHRLLADSRGVSLRKLIERFALFQSLYDRTKPNGAYFSDVIAIEILVNGKTLDTNQYLIDKYARLPDTGLHHLLRSGRPDAESLLESLLAAGIVESHTVGDFLYSDQERAWLLRLMELTQGMAPELRHGMLQRSLRKKAGWLDLLELLGAQDEARKSVPVEDLRRLLHSCLAPAERTHLAALLGRLADDPSALPPIGEKDIFLEFRMRLRPLAAATLTDLAACLAELDPALNAKLGPLGPALEAARAQDRRLLQTLMADHAGLDIQSAVRAQLSEPVRRLFFSYDREVQRRLLFLILQWYRQLGESENAALARIQRATPAELLAVSDRINFQLKWEASFLPFLKKALYDHAWRKNRAEANQAADVSAPASPAAWRQALVDAGLLEPGFALPLPADTATASPAWAETLLALKGPDQQPWLDADQVYFLTRQLSVQALVARLPLLLALHGRSRQQPLNGWLVVDSLTSPTPTEVFAKLDAFPDDPLLLHAALVSPLSAEAIAGLHGLGAMAALPAAYLAFGLIRQIPRDTLTDWIAQLGALADAGEKANLFRRLRVMHLDHREFYPHAIADPAWELPEALDWKDITYQFTLERFLEPADRQHIDQSPLLYSHPQDRLFLLLSSLRWRGHQLILDPGALPRLYPADQQARVWLSRLRLIKTSAPDYLENPDLVAELMASGLDQNQLEDRLLAAGKEEFPEELFRLMLRRGYTAEFLIHVHGYLRDHRVAEPVRQRFLDSHLTEKEIFGHLKLIADCETLEEAEALHLKILNRRGRQPPEPATAQESAADQELTPDFRLRRDFLQQFYPDAAGLADDPECTLPRMAQAHDLLRPLPAAERASLFLKTFRRALTLADLARIAAGRTRAIDPLARFFLPYLLPSLRRDTVAAYQLRRELPNLSRLPAKDREIARLAGAPLQGIPEEQLRLWEPYFSSSAVLRLALPGQSAWEAARATARAQPRAWLQQVDMKQLLETGLFTSSNEKAWKEKCAEYTAGRIGEQTLLAYLLKTLGTHHGPFWIPRFSPQDRSRLLAAWQGPDLAKNFPLLIALNTRLFRTRSGKRFLHHSVLTAALLSPHSQADILEVIEAYLPNIPRSALQALLLSAHPLPACRQRLAELMTTLPSDHLNFERVSAALALEEETWVRLNQLLDPFAPVLRRGLLVNILEGHLLAGQLVMLLTRAPEAAVWPAGLLEVLTRALKPGEPQLARSWLQHLARQPFARASSEETAIANLPGPRLELLARMLLAERLVLPILQARLPQRVEPGRTGLRRVRWVESLQYGLQPWRPILRLLPPPQRGSLVEDLAQAFADLPGQPARDPESLRRIITATNEADALRELFSGLRVAGQPWLSEEAVALLSRHMSLRQLRERMDLLRQLYPQARAPERRGAWDEPTVVSLLLSPKDPVRIVRLLQQTAPREGRLLRSSLYTRMPDAQVDALLRILRPSQLSVRVQEEALTREYPPQRVAEVLAALTPAEKQNDALTLAAFRCGRPGPEIRRCLDALHFSGLPASSQVQLLVSPWDYPRLARLLILLQAWPQAERAPLLADALTNHLDFVTLVQLVQRQPQAPWAGDRRQALLELADGLAVSETTADAEMRNRQAIEWFVESLPAETAHAFFLRLPSGALAEDLSAALSRGSAPRTEVSFRDLSALAPANDPLSQLIPEERLEAMGRILAEDAGIFNAMLTAMGLPQVLSPNRGGLQNTLTLYYSLQRLRLDGRPWRDPQWLAAWMQQAVESPRPALFELHQRYQYEVDALEQRAAFEKARWQALPGKPAAALTGLVARLVSLGLLSEDQAWRSLNGLPEAAAFAALARALLAAIRLENAPWFGPAQSERLAALPLPRLLLALEKEAEQYARIQKFLFSRSMAYPQGGTYGERIRASLQRLEAAGLLLAAQVEAALEVHEGKHSSERTLVYTMLSALRQDQAVWLAPEEKEHLARVVTLADLSVHGHRLGYFLQREASGVFADPRLIAAALASGWDDDSLYAWLDSGLSLESLLAGLASPRSGREALQLAAFFANRTYPEAFLVSALRGPFAPGHLAWLEQLAQGRPEAEPPQLFGKMLGQAFTLEEFLETLAWLQTAAGLSAEKLLAWIDLCLPKQPRAAGGTSRQTLLDHLQLLDPAGDERLRLMRALVWEDTPAVGDSRRRLEGYYLARAALAKMPSETVNLLVGAVLGHSARAKRIVASLAALQAKETQRLADQRQQEAQRTRTSRAAWLAAAPELVPLIQQALDAFGPVLRPESFWGELSEENVLAAPPEERAPKVVAAMLRRLTLEDAAWLDEPLVLALSQALDLATLAQRAERLLALRAAEAKTEIFLADATLQLAVTSARPDPEVLALLEGLQGPGLEVLAPAALVSRKPVEEILRLHQLADRTQLPYPEEALAYASGLEEIALGRAMQALEPFSLADKSRLFPQLLGQDLKLEDVLALLAEQDADRVFNLLGLLEDQPREHFFAQLLASLPPSLRTMVDSADWPALLTLLQQIQQWTRSLSGFQISGWLRPSPAQDGQDNSPNMGQTLQPHAEDNPRLAELIRQGRVSRLAEGTVVREQAELQEGSGAAKVVAGADEKRIQSRVLDRVNRLRAAGGLLEQLARDLSLQPLAQALRLPEAKVREDLLEIARRAPLLVVHRRYELFEKGPFAHARRGLSRNNDIAIWLGEHTLASGRISDHDLGLLLLEEAKHILAPSLDHRNIAHDPELLTRLLAARLAKTGELCQVSPSAGMSLYPTVVVENIVTVLNQQGWLSQDAFDARLASWLPASRSEDRCFDLILRHIGQQGPMFTETEIGKLRYRGIDHFESKLGVWAWLNQQDPDRSRYPRPVIAQLLLRPEPLDYLQEYLAVFARHQVTPGAMPRLLENGSRTPADYEALLAYMTGQGWSAHRQSELLFRDLTLPEIVAHAEPLAQARISGLPALIREIQAQRSRQEAGRLEKRKNAVVDVLEKHGLFLDKLGLAEALAKLDLTHEQASRWVAGAILAAIQREGYAWLQGVEILPELLTMDKLVERLPLLIRMYGMHDGSRASLSRVSVVKALGNTKSNDENWRLLGRNKGDLPGGMLEDMLASGREAASSLRILDALPAALERRREFLRAALPEKHRERRILRLIEEVKPLGQKSLAIFKASLAYQLSPGDFCRLLSAHAATPEGLGPNAILRLSRESLSEESGQALSDLADELLTHPATDADAFLAGCTPEQLAWAAGLASLAPEIFLGVLQAFNSFGIRAELSMAESTQLRGLLDSSRLFTPAPEPESEPGEKAAVAAAEDDPRPSPQTRRKALEQSLRDLRQSLNQVFVLENDQWVHRVTQGFKPTLYADHCLVKRVPKVITPDDHPDGLELAYNKQKLWIAHPGFEVFGNITVHIENGEIVQVWAGDPYPENRPGQPDREVPLLWFKTPEHAAGWRLAGRNWFYEVTAEGKLAPFAFAIKGFVKLMTSKPHLIVKPVHLDRLGGFANARLGWQRMLGMEYADDVALEIVNGELVRAWKGDPYPENFLTTPAAALPIWEAGKGILPAASAPLTRVIRKLCQSPWFDQQAAMRDIYQLPLNAPDREGLVRGIILQRLRLGEVRALPMAIRTVSAKEFSRQLGRWEAITRRAPTLLTRPELADEAGRFMAGRLLLDDAARLVSLLAETPEETRALLAVLTEHGLTFPNAITAVKRHFLEITQHAWISPAVQIFKEKPDLLQVIRALRAMNPGPRELLLEHFTRFLNNLKNGQNGAVAIEAGRIKPGLARLIDHAERWANGQITFKPTAAPRASRDAVDEMEDPQRPRWDDFGELKLSPRGMLWAALALGLAAGWLAPSDGYFHPALFGALASLLVLTLQLPRWLYAAALRWMQTPAWSEEAQAAFRARLSRRLGSLETAFRLPADYQRPVLRLLDPSTPRRHLGKAQAGQLWIHPALAAWEARAPWLVDAVLAHEFREALALQARRPAPKFLRHWTATLTEYTVLLARRAAPSSAPAFETVEVSLNQLPAAVRNPLVNRPLGRMDNLDRIARALEALVDRGGRGWWLLQALVFAVINRTLAQPAVAAEQDRELSQALLRGLATDSGLLRQVLARNRRIVFRPLDQPAWLRLWRGTWFGECFPDEEGRLLLFLPRGLLNPGTSTWRAAFLSALAPRLIRKGLAFETQLLTPSEAPRFLAALFRMSRFAPRGMHAFLHSLWMSRYPAAYLQVALPGANRHLALAWLNPEERAAVAGSYAAFSRAPWLGHAEHVNAIFFRNLQEVPTPALGARDSSADGVMLWLDLVRFCPWLQTLDGRPQLSGPAQWAFKGLAGRWRATDQRRRPASPRPVRSLNRDA